MRASVGTNPASPPLDLPAHAVPDKNLVSVDGADADTIQKASTAAKKRSRSVMMRALGKTVRLRDKDHRRFVLRQLRRSWTCQFKIELVLTTMRAPMWRASFPRTSPACKPMMTRGWQAALPYLEPPGGTHVPAAASTALPPSYVTPSADTDTRAGPLNLSSRLAL
jgi:hypothetical protein